MKTKEIIDSYRVSCADKAVHVDGKGSSLLWLLLWLLCAGHDDILCVVVDSLVVAVRCGCLGAGFSGRGFGDGRRGVF